MLEMSLSLLRLVPKRTLKQTKPFFFSVFFFFFPSPPVLVAAVRVSPCHSRQPSIISDASALEGDRSSTPSDINSPRHRTHSLCNVRAALPLRPLRPPPPPPVFWLFPPCLPRPLMLSPSATAGLTWSNTCMSGNAPSFASSRPCTHPFISLSLSPPSHSP